VTHTTDTHPLVWFLSSNPRLSAAARAAFEDASTQIIIPTMVLAEIHFLSARGRIPVDVATVLAYVQAAPNCRVHPLDETVITRLPLNLNIHDAIIVATALVYRDDLGEEVALITKDTEITDSGLVPVIW
jgi:PIN domain nuclease of toxin-antitoxin system